MYIKKPVLCCLLLLLVNGCAYSPEFQLFRQAMEDSRQLTDEERLIRAVNESPYAIIAASINGGESKVFVLERYSDRGLVWASGDGDQLETRNGRVLGASGPSVMEINTVSQQPDPVAGGLHQQPGKSPDWSYTVSRPGQGLSSGEVQSRFFLVGRETITILRNEIPTLHFREEITGPGIAGKLENHYWVDPNDGTVWRTSQHYALDETVLTVDVYKKAAQLKERAAYQ